MSDYGRRIVVNLDFETAVGETNRLLRQEGLKIIARVDVRDHFWGDGSHDLGRYLLIDAWSSALAADALQHNLDVGPILPITFAIYELPDGESVVVAKEPLAPYASNAEWRRDFRRARGDGRRGSRACSARVCRTERTLASRPVHRAGGVTRRTVR